MGQNYRRYLGEDKVRQCGTNNSISWVRGTEGDMLRRNVFVLQMKKCGNLLKEVQVTLCLQPVPSFDTGLKPNQANVG